MQVYGEAAYFRQRELRIEQFGDIVHVAVVVVGRAAQHATQQPALGRRGKIGQPSAIVRCVHVYRHRTGRLQYDATLPRGPYLGEHRPAQLGLSFVGINMRTQRRRAIHISTTHRKLHPRADVLVAPVALAILEDGLARTGERGTEAAHAADDLRFINVGVQVDQRRPELAPAQFKARKSACHRLPGSGNSRQPSLLDAKIDEHRAFGIRNRSRRYITQ